MATEIPPLPEGFTLDQTDAIPPLPEGFTLDVQQQPRTTGQEFGRQLQLTGRTVLEGLGDLAAIPANALAGVGNLLLEIDRRIADNKDRAVIGDQSQVIPQALNAAGVAIPEAGAEQLVNTIGRRAVATGATMGVGGAIAQAPGAAGQVGRALASNPVVQATSAATGPIAGEIAERAGAGAGGQAVADLVGSMTPAVVAAAAPAAVRAGFRGGQAGRQRMEQNIESFQRAGTTPSVGQATESRVMRGAESLLARTPGGAGQMAAKAEAQADELSVAIERRAAQLMKKTSAEQAGRQIQRSISGEGGFVETFKSRQSQLFDQLDNFLPKEKLVDVSRTKDALTKLNAEIPGAPNVSRMFQNARIGGIERALSADTSAMPGSLDKFAPGLAKDGKLPYEALKKLRTLVGNEMADAGLASDVPRSKWKALYAALSDDMKAAADEAGPQAQAAWTRANNFTRAGMRRIEVIESVIDKNGGPEAIFRAATSNTKEGATTLRAVMQSVDNEGKKMVSATVLRRLGLAKAGVQGELGDKFSTETFLTNWNLLSPEAKRTLFDRYGPKFRADMDQVARVAANLREGSQVFRNPSGTGQATTQAATVGGFVLSVVTGQAETATAIAAGVGGANLTARLMTNPRFVHWLARSTKIPMGAYGSALNSLAKTAQESGDKDLALAVAVLEHDQKQ